jgi:hypothetical protein
MESYPRVAIIYLSYNSEPYLDDVIAGLKRLNYPKDRVEFVVVDNAHPEFGSSVRVLREDVLPFSGNEIPHTTILAQEKNLGFAEGNNMGIKWALENNFDYIFLHNQDGFLAGDSLERLVDAMENDKKIGVAQSLVVLHPETNLVNSSGNEFQYLGFGFCGDYKKEVSEIENKIKEINYASGASLLMRADLLREFGLWDDDFFMYHEDLEYCMRLRAVGYKIVLVPSSIFYHKYQFSRSILKFYWMERNRYGVLLMFFKWPTLLILSPMLLILEGGLWVFAFKSGWLNERLKVYKYWLKTDSWKLWFKKRKNIQKIRKVGDRELLKDASTGIFFQEKSMENPLLKYVGNPVMYLYYWLVIRTLIWW